MKSGQILSALVIISALFLASCANTVRGVGKDVGDTARATEGAVKNVVN